MQYREIIEDIEDEGTIDAWLAPFRQLAKKPTVVHWIDTVLRQWASYQDDVATLKPERLEALKNAIQFLNDATRFPPDIQVRKVWAMMERDAQEQASPAHHLRPINVNTPAFAQWFGDSKVVDARGNPLVCFRGTTKVPNATRFGTKRTVPSFTSSPDVASVYASSPDFFGAFSFQQGATVSPVYLSIQHPVDLAETEQASLDDLCDLLGADVHDPDDQASMLSLIQQLRHRDENGVMPFKYELPPGVVGEMDWEDYGIKMASLYRRGKIDAAVEFAADTTVDVYAVIDCRAFIEWAKRHKFDGVIHLDVFDRGAQIGAPLLGKDEFHGVSDDMHVTYRPFYAHQVKSIFNQGTWDKDRSMTESIPAVTATQSSNTASRKNSP